MFSKASSRYARNFVCPECGNAPDGKPGRSVQVLTCAGCGTKASVAEWTQRWPDENVVTGHAGQPPSTTKIRRETLPDAAVWHIPAHGSFGFFMFFGILWTLITAVVSGGFLFAFLTGGEIKGGLPDWTLIPFFGVFWAVGLACLYLGVRQKWMKHRLSVANGQLVLRREIFGRSKEKSLPVAGIIGIEQKVFYQQNYQQVFGIEVKGARGKLRFGSALDAAEKAWLVADLREAVFGPAKPAAMTSPEAGSSNRRRQAFSVELPHSRKQLWPLAIASSLVGVTFLIVSVTLLNEPWESWQSDQPIPIRVFDAIFNVFTHGMQAAFFLMGLATFIGGLALLVHLVRSRGQVRKLEGNATEIAVRTYRNNRVWQEKTYACDTVSDIRASQSGSSGSKVMKRIELIAGDEAIKLAGWIDGDAADALVAQIKPCL